MVRLSLSYALTRSLHLDWSKLGLQKSLSSSLQLRPMTIGATLLSANDENDLVREKPKHNTHIERTSTQFRERVNAAPGTSNVRDSSSHRLSPYDRPLPQSNSSISKYCRPLLANSMAFLITDAMSRICSHSSRDNGLIPMCRTSPSQVVSVLSRHRKPSTKLG